MADNYDALVPTGTPPTGTEAITIRSTDADGAQVAHVILAGADGNRLATIPVSLAAAPLPTDAATQTTLAAVLSALSSVPVTGPVTDAQLRATPVPVSGTVTASGPLTDTQLRATAVPVSGTVTASGPLTDAELRATPVGVSGTFWQATQPVSGTVTANLGTIGSAATETTLEAARALLADVLSVAGSDTNAVGTMTRPADTAAYTAGDGVTTATSAAAGMTVANCARVNGGSGRIVGIRATKSQTSTTNSRFRLWIWRTAPAIPNDNAAYSPSLRANNADLVGTAEVNFSSGVVGSDGIMATATLARSSMAFVCASGTRDLTIVWQALEAYTPASGEVFAVAVDCAQN